MEQKKSFILYIDYEQNFSMLTDEQLGKLLRIIINYEKTQQNPDTTQLEPILQMAFTFIKGDLDRARAKYNASVNNGKKGGRPRNKKPSKTQQNLDKPNPNLNEDVDVDVNDDVDVNVISLFEKEFGRTLSPIEMQSILSLKETFDYELVKLALSEAIKNGVRTLRYIEVILSNWKQAGVKSVQDAETMIKNHKEKGNKSITQTWEQTEEQEMSEEQLNEIMANINSLGGETK